MSLSDRIQQLSEAKGISQSELEKTLGFGKGTISKWKGATVPSADKLLKIAEYFKVTLDYLMTGKEDSKETAPELTAKDRRDIAKDVENIMNKLTSGESGPASYRGEELDSEAAELFKDELELALKRLKVINKEKYTNKRYKK
ncbi:MAG: helix-turn-helix domain-containing protein [Clostridium sp.]|nr:helix-turn-helix domain-containing protein [Clostridium sp.]